jgi:anti-anti-sigma factor
MEQNGIEVRIEDLEDRPRTKVIHLGGNLEAKSITRVNQSVLPLLNSGIVNLVFDCSNLRYVTSPALGILINYYKRTREQGGAAKFFGLDPNILDIFRIVGLTKTFEIYADRDEALASLEPEAEPV